MAEEASKAVGTDGSAVEENKVDQLLNTSTAPAPLPTPEQPEREMSVKFGGVTTATIPSVPPPSEAEVQQKVDAQLKTITDILQGIF